MGSTDSMAMGSKGAYWTSKIYFDPDADGDGLTPLEVIEDSEIRAAMKKYENETIQHAKSYKIPLREYQWWDFQIFYHEWSWKLTKLGGVLKRLTRESAFKRQDQKRQL